MNLRRAGRETAAAVKKAANAFDRQEAPLHADAEETLANTAAHAKTWTASVPGKVDAQATRMAVAADRAESEAIRLQEDVREATAKVKTKTKTKTKTGPAARGR